MYCTEYVSPIGNLFLTSDGIAVTGLWIAGQKYYAVSATGEERNFDDLPVFIAAKAWLDGYFAGNMPSISQLSLAPKGSEFRQAVWQKLCEIPYGTIVTYGDIAKAITRETGKRASARAVGGAVGHNPISLIIPCHRVVGVNSLTGYAGGLDIKVSLLKREGIDLSRLI